MKKQIKLQMVQIYGHSWNIISEAGHIIQKDIRLNTSAEAEDYIRRYVSSYPAMGYVMVPASK